MHDNELKTEFVVMNGPEAKKTILLQVLSFPDSELKLDSCILKLTDGEKHPSPKILFLLEKAAKNASEVKRNLMI